MSRKTCKTEYTSQQRSKFNRKFLKFFLDKIFYLKLEVAFLLGTYKRNVPDRVVIFIQFVIQ
jgi:hypothetical protein